MRNTIFVLYFYLLIVGCSGPSNEIKKSKILIRRLDDTTRLILFPFNFTGFRSERLKQYFTLNIHIDSIEEENEGFKSRTYKFYAGHSFITFFVKPSSEDSHFYLVSGNLEKGFIKLKKGFDYDMDIKDCFHMLGVNYVNCDTLCLMEGDLATTYTFIFKEKKLSKIDIETEPD